MFCVVVVASHKMMWSVEGEKRVRIHNDIRIFWCAE